VKTLAPVRRLSRRGSSGATPSSLAPRFGCPLLEGLREAVGSDTIPNKFEERNNVYLREEEEDEF